MTKRVPMSALVVAVVVAFLLGTAGTATAGALTAKSVKKIAAKVIAKKAPGLSVAHAETATTATSAASATSAGNSSQLGGAAPSAYQDRIAHGNQPAITAVIATTVAQLTDPTSITVPAGVGFVHVTGVVTFFAGGGNLTVWPSLDSTCSQSGANYEHRVLGNNALQTTVAVDMVAAVTPGSHNIRLCAIVVVDSNVGTRSQTIQTVASGPNG